MGTKEAIIKTTTEPGLLQDELLGINTLSDMLITGKVPPSRIGNCNTVIQNGKSIIDSGVKIGKSMGVLEDSNNSN